MNAELIVSQMLATPTITNLVGNRKALYQLPENTAFPALVYQIIDNVPDPNLDYVHPAGQLARARIQFNPLAATIAEVKNIHNALRVVFDFKHNTLVGSKRIMSCRLNFLGTMEKDNEAGVWTQPADYTLAYYE